MVMRRRAMLGEEAEIPDLLPSEYQQVEYIGATGASQYILTQIYPKNGYIKFVAEYYKATQATKTQDLFCPYKLNAALNFEVGFSPTKNRLYAYSSSSAQVIDPLIYGNKCLLETVFQPTSPYASLSVTANGMTVSGTKTGANASDINSDPICIFGSPQHGVNSDARLYSCKIYDSPSNLAFNGIPCYRKSDGEIGMYDTVSETFFTNAGAGTFIKGADV